MCLRKAVHIAIFVAVLAVVVAEPPAAYGPPSFTPFQNIDVSNYMRHTGQSELIQRGYKQVGFQRQYDTGFQRGGFQRGGYQKTGYQTGGYQTGGYQTGGYQSGGYHNGGYHSGGYQDNYNNVAPQPFSFQYEVKDPQSGNDFGHQASSNGNQVKGEYYVLLPDGRRQVVTYVADDNGYNADVHYEGQATVPQQSGYGGYSDNQYSGYRGNHGGYRGDFGGYKGNFGGYRY